MKLLAFESTTSVASVALLDGERCLASCTVDAGLKHSEILLPMAQEVLAHTKLAFSDVGGYAVAVGPGSFTGVRIGVATVKGLAFGRDLPIVEVSALEALAYNLLGVDATVVCAMDARRDEIYTATFRTSPEGVLRLCEDRAIPISLLLSEWKDDGTPVYIVGDAYEKVRRALTEAGVSVLVTPPALRAPSAHAVGLCALRSIERGETVSDLRLSPSYLRLPQAERERLERLANENNPRKDNDNAKA